MTLGTNGPAGEPTEAAPLDLNVAHFFLASFVGLLASGSLTLGSITGVLLQPNSFKTGLLYSFGAGALLAALAVVLIAPTVADSSDPDFIAEHGEKAAKINVVILAMSSILGGLVFLLLEEVFGNRAGRIKKFLKSLQNSKLGCWSPGSKRRLHTLSGSSEFFQALTQEKHQQLARNMHYICYHTNDVIFRQGEVSKKLWIVKSGSVELQIVPGESFHSSGTGDVLGGLAFLTGEAQIMTAIATADVEAYFVDYHVFISLMDGEDSLKLALMHDTSKILRDLTQANREAYLFRNSLMDMWQARLTGLVGKLQPSHTENLLAPTAGPGVTTGEEPTNPVSVHVDVYSPSWRPPTRSSKAHGHQDFQVDIFSPGSISDGYTTQYDFEAPSLLGSPLGGFVVHSNPLSSSVVQEAIVSGLQTGVRALARTLSIETEEDKRHFVSGLANGMPDRAAQECNGPSPPQPLGAEMVDLSNREHAGLHADGDQHMTTERIESLDRSPEIPLKRMSEAVSSQIPRASPGKVQYECPITGQTILVDPDEGHFEGEHVDLLCDYNSICRSMRVLEEGGSARAFQPPLHWSSSSATHSGPAPIGVWLGNLLDGVAEAVVIGVQVSHLLLANGVSVGGAIPYTLIAGLCLPNFPEAMAASMTMYQYGWGKRRVVLMWLSLTLMIGVGSGLGYVLATVLSHSLVVSVEGFAAGAMLVMIVGSMIPEAVELCGASLTGMGVLAGFTASYLFELLQA